MSDGGKPRGIANDAHAAILCAVLVTKDPPEIIFETVRIVAVHMIVRGGAADRFPAPSPLSLAPAVPAYQRFDRVSLGAASQASTGTSLAPAGHVN